MSESYVPSDGRNHAFTKTKNLWDKMCRTGRKFCMTSLWWHWDTERNILVLFVHMWEWTYGQKQVFCATVMRFLQKRAWSKNSDTAYTFQSSYFFQNITQAHDKLHVKKLQNSKMYVWNKSESLKYKQIRVSIV